MSQKYIDSYKTQFPWVAKSYKGVHYALYTLCKTHFGVGHSGIYDFRLHEKHKDMIRDIKSTKYLRQLSPSDEDKSVIRAERYMALLIIEHNLSISTADHLSDLFKLMFPKCETAQKFTCKRPKATYTIKELGDSCKSTLAKCLKSEYFIVSTNGSADRGGQGEDNFTQY